MNKKTKCYIYTRVSTAIQVDGYSLDAQKDKIRKYAEFQEMEIVGEYSDEGHSGKNIKGRPEFMKMLNDIEDGKVSNRRLSQVISADYLRRKYLPHSAVNDADAHYIGWHRRLSRAYFSSAMTGLK